MKVSLFIDKIKTFPNMSRTGFTIVELLIVIVVIGILAAISIVAYTGIQDRANDTLRRDAASKLEKAYTLYIADTGLTPKTMGCGSYDDGTGFIQYSSTTGQYAGDSCVAILAQKNYLSQDFNSSIPIGTAWNPTYRDRTFMITHCTSTNTSALLWYLKNPTAEETSNFTAIAQRCKGTATFTYGTDYAMNSGVLLEW